MPARPALDGYAPLCRRAADAMREAGLSQPEQWEFDWERTYTRDEWLDQVPTAGTLTQAPPEQLADLLAGVGAAIDGAGGAFPVQYRTAAVTAVRA
jgi:hypothetical protein